MKKINHEKPENLGFSSERLFNIKKFLDEKYITPGIIPNYHLLVARKGQVVLDEVSGFSHVESKEKLKKDNIFRIFSMTKAVTSVVLMRLYEQGFFQLDDPLLEDIKVEILATNIDALTPIEALMKLNEIKRMLIKD